MSDESEESEIRLQWSCTVKVEPFRASDSSEIVPFISFASFRHMYNRSQTKKE